MMTMSINIMTMTSDAVNDGDRDYDDCDAQDDDNDEDSAGLYHSTAELFHHDLVERKLPNSGERSGRALPGKRKESYKTSMM